MEKELLYKKMIEMAYKATEYAYAPYSHFYVGAALLTSDGEIYTGCNVENAAYGVSNCAERTALFKAVSEGKRSFSAIAVVNAGGGPTFPCGICRQALSEFSPSMDIITENDDKSLSVISLNELLPCSFSKSALDGE